MDIRIPPLEDQVSARVRPPEVRNLGTEIGRHGSFPERGSPGAAPLSRFQGKSQQLFLAKVAVSPQRGIRKGGGDKTCFSDLDMA